MKTFEERYTAWIDGELTGNTLTAFEQELARRAQTGDAEAAELDKDGALHLRALLKDHLGAPALTNTEFFSHQMRDRIDAEIEKAARQREATARPAWKLPAFAWPFARYAGVGVVALFVAGALYYGLAPAHPKTDQSVAVSTSSPKQVSPGSVAENNAAPAPATQTADSTRAGNDKLVFLTPQPKPIDLNEDIQVTPNNSAGSNDPATTLRMGNANVLWLNNPPYLPNVDATSPVPAPSSAAAPSAPATTPQ